MVDGEGWQRYGRAITGAMAEVLVIGLEHPVEASRLLALIEADENERANLSGDGAGFLAEALP